jgi:hypothetical protein
MMGWPGKQTVVASLGTDAKQVVGKIHNVELLGVGKVPFSQDAAGLTIQLPDKSPSDYAVTFKIKGA